MSLTTIQRSLHDNFEYHSYKGPSLSENKKKTKGNYIKNKVYHTHTHTHGGTVVSVQAWQPRVLSLIPQYPLATCHYLVLPPSGKRDGENNECVWQMVWPDWKNHKEWNDKVSVYKYGRGSRYTRMTPMQWDDKVLDNVRERGGMKLRGLVHQRSILSTGINGYFSAMFTP